jgi:hypothetical protein
MDNQDGRLDRNQAFFEHKRLQEFVRSVSNAAVIFSLP